MHTNRHRIFFFITFLILLSFACSYLTIPGGKPAPTTIPASATPAILPVVPTDVIATITIPVFVPTDTASAASVETATSVPATAPAKKTKTPSVILGVTQEQVCPNAQPTRLKLNGFAYLSYDPFLPNRIRVGPGVGYDAKGLIQPGEVMQLVSGPICSGQSVWWKVIVKFTEENGWIAEADNEQYWLVPCPVDGHCPPLAP
jgi:hypothetical protein